MEGSGIGSAHVLEVFVDFGYIGVAVFFFILGYLLIYALRFAQKGTFAYSIVLIAIDGILMMPRGSAIHPFILLTTAQFWVSAAACFACSRLLLYAHDCAKGERLVPAHPANRQ